MRYSEYANIFHALRFPTKAADIRCRLRFRQAEVFLFFQVGFLAKDLCINRDAKESNGVVRVEDDDNSQDDFKEDESEAANNEVALKSADLRLNSHNNGVEVETRMFSIQTE